jgi:integrase/recombinase XerD
MRWAIQRSTEGKNDRNVRVSFVRQLALYMRSLGKDPYVPKHFASETVGVPHILSRTELASFFSVIGTGPYKLLHEARHPLRG